MVESWRAGRTQERDGEKCQPPFHFRPSFGPMPQLYNEDRTNGGDDDDTIKGLGSGEGGAQAANFQVRFARSIGII